MSTTAADPKGGGASVAYQAAAGELNRLVVRPGAAGRLVLADSGAVIEPQDAGCRRVDEHTADCAAAPISAALLDGDDRAEVDPAVKQRASLGGGPGSDFLRGGSGDDEIRGDARDPFADELDGGAGSDTLDYSDHTAGVTVDLATPGAPAGAAGENDRPQRFEKVTGGEGDDQLFGNGADNLLIGNGGRNVLRGRGGADRLDSQGSTRRLSEDVADGGAGPDRIVVSGPGFTSVRCGSGRDVVTPTPTTLLARDCESWALSVFADRSDVLLPVAPAIRGRRVTFRAPCPRRAPGARCAGRLVLRDSRSGLLLGTKTYRARSRGARATVPVVIVLRADDARRLRRGLRVIVEMQVTVRGPGKAVDRGRSGYTFDLR